MCSSFWNLTAEVTCPCCKWQGTVDLTTHFKGEAGAFLDYFNLEEPVEYLEGYTGVMQGTHGDAFDATCPKCHTSWFLGAQVKEGRVIRVWNLTCKV